MRILTDPRVEQVVLDKLRLYPGNPRTHSKKQIQQIAASIQRFGFTSPLLVSDDLEIIAGAGRLLAARQLGLERVPVKRIVIVDDDGDLLGEACEFLLLSGYLVHSCQSPLEAMVIIQSNEVDVLISDIEMPEMDGTALAKWTNEQHGTVQVILVSGLDKPDGQIDNKWSFFRKPIDFAKVCSVIDAAT